MSDIEPTEYLPEPDHDVQDLDGEEDIEELARFFAAPTAPRDWKQTLDWANGQITDRDRDWQGLCQMFCRSAVGVGGGFGSAFSQWLGAPEEAKHSGGDPDTAPAGAMLCSKGDNPNGHIMIAARPFSTGTGAAISTDAVRVGWPDRVSRQGLLDAWGHEYLGWIENVNGVWIDTRPSPTPKVPYEALASAVDTVTKTINFVRAARDTAKAQKNWKHVDILNNQIVLLVQRKQKLTDLYETLRRD